MPASGVSLDLDDGAVVNRIASELAKSPSARQNIRSQWIDVSPGRAEVPLPELFQLFGQRFVLDSFVLSKVVFDSITFEGKKQERMMPTGLDVMAALGDDEAVILLEPEIDKYKYAANLLAARTLVEEQPPAIWNATLYNVWLNAR